MDTARLPPELSDRVVAFSRACRAAARAVALYPPGHRAVEDAVGRVTETARRAAGDAGLTLDVLPDGLRVGGAAPDRHDASVGELAALLYAHQIGGLTLHATADRESWQVLLGLLGRSPDDNRRDGGLARLWQAAGGPSLEVHAIDYATLLREGHGGSLSRLLRAANDGLLEALSLSDLESVIDAVEARRAGARVEADEGDAAAGQAIARLGGLVLARRGDEDPARIDAALARLARLTETLSADGMNGLVGTRETGDDTGGDAGGAAAVLDRLGDQGRARFVTAALVAEGSATARLCEAFEALVPADDRRRVASLAAGLLPDAAPPADVPRLRQELDQLVTSYDDRRFVGRAYARELTLARGRAQDLETARPDPPERIDAWLATVSDGALRALDLQVLTDLLAIDGQPVDQHEAISVQAAARIEELARVGLVDPALTLARTLDAACEAPGARGDAARAGFERLRGGTIVRDLVPLVRRAAPGEVDSITALLERLGPSIAPALATALSRESDAAARERLRAVLAGFGDAGEQAVRALLTSDHAETRRNAALLLRDFGGAASVDVLERLLADRDPRVRREALRALAVDDDPGARQTVIEALEAATPDARRALVDELGLVRDARVVPLLVALAARWTKRHTADTAIRAVTLLGLLGPAATRDAIDALAALLPASLWWSPRRARAVREQAATALGTLNTPDARAALAAAADRGGRGSTEARQALARRPS